MSRYFARTKYDKHLNPVMTSLYDTTLLRTANVVQDITEQRHFVIAIAGFKTTDEMLELARRRK